MRRPLRLLPTLMLFGLLFLPSAALADPFVITDGTIVRVGQNASNETTYDFSGPRISVQGGFVESNASCNPCRVGDSNNLNVSFANGGGGPVVIDGVTFTGVGFGHVLNALTTSFTLPPPTSSPFEVTLTLPFTLSGTLTGCTGSPFFCTDQLFSVDLTGQGFAMVQFVNGGNFGSTYFVRDITYTFQPAVAPVPEPATLLLLGTGVAGVAAKIRKRRRASK